MKCALQIQWTATAARTEGYFLHGGDPNILSRFFNKDLKELPRVFPLAAGYLVLGEIGSKPPSGRLTALQSLAGRLFFPVHARLLPALLPDEILGIAKGAGLLLLPHLPAMSFDFAKPMPLSDWIEVDAPSNHSPLGDAWKPFPKRPQTAKELTRIERPSPPVLAILDLLGGAPDRAKPLSFNQDGTGAVPEDARPPESSTWETIKGQVNLKSGQFLAWIGNMTRLPGLSQFGAEMAKKALESVPRLTEKLLGSQEAALREVLRQLRSGDIEKGLRRAPIAISDPQWGSGRVGTSSRLSEQSPFYSLSKLLGGAAGHAVSWLGGGTVWNDLAGEYRKLAQEAMDRGDFRRAAYLYGFLLNDLRSAAGALIAGGMFRDAAILYRDKLNDPMLAAKTFEKAGDWDEAVRLYVQERQYELAGILLERLGEDDQARDLFIRQANLHAEAGRHLQAGDLIAKKVGDHGLARKFYQKGWDANGVETRVCGQRLLDQSAAAKDWETFQEWAIQAKAKRDVIGFEEASRVSNHALNLSREQFAGVRDLDLRDQARLFFGTIVHAEAGQSRKRGENASGTLFGMGRTWPAAVYRDALFAARTLSASKSKKQQEQAAQPATALLNGPVRFAIVSRQTRDLVVASDSQILVWRPDQGTIHPVINYASYGKTIGIACDPIASKIYVLTSLEMQGTTPAVSEDIDPENATAEQPLVKYYLQLFVCRSASTFQLATSIQIDALGGTPWIQSETESGDPVSGGESQSGKSAQIIHVDNAQERFQFAAFDLLQKRTVAKSTQGAPFFSASSGPGSYWSWDRFTVTYTESIKGRMQVQEWSPGWFSYWEAPQIGRGMRFDWIFPEAKQLDLAWIDLAANLHWSTFEVQKMGKPHSFHRIHSGDRPYRAVSLLGPGKVAALTEDGEIQWLKMLDGKFVSFAPKDKPAAGSPLTYIFARPHAEELIALEENGTAIRVKTP